MINSEQAFELLPYAVDIYEKIDFDSYRKKVQADYKKLNKQGKKVDPTDAGIDAFKHILRNSTKVKEEFFEIVAIIDGKDVEEIRKQSFIKTVGTIKELFSDKELVSFFKQAV